MEFVRERLRQECDPEDDLYKVTQLISSSPQDCQSIIINPKWHSEELVDDFFFSFFAFLSSPDSQNLESLVIKKLVLTDKQLTNFSEILHTRTSTSLVSLELNNVTLCAPPPDNTTVSLGNAFSKLIEQNTTLTSLVWKNNATLYRQTDRITDALCTSNTTLQYLDLSCSNFSYSSLAKILDCNSTLQFLSVYNGFPHLINNDSESEEEGFEEFCHSLATNTSLWELNLDGKSILDDGPFFVHALQENKTLSRLSFILDPQGILDSDFFASLDTLTHLEIHSFGPIDCQPEVFCTFLNTNTSLTSLKLWIQFVEVEQSPYWINTNTLNVRQIDCPETICNAFEYSPSMVDLDLAVSLFIPQSLHQIRAKKNHNQKMKNLHLFGLLLNSCILEYSGFARRSSLSA